ncbi:MAG: nucleoside-diphosphate sugar epimerase/dehydratase [Planctomycetota bacterium]
MWLWVKRRRPFFVAIFHLLLTAVSWYVAYSLRTERTDPWNDLYGGVFFTGLALLLVIRFGMFFAFDLFHGMWRYVSIADLASIVRAVSLGSALFAPFVVFWLGPQSGGPHSKSVLVVDWALSILLLGGVRFAIRSFREVFVPMRRGANRVVIAGAGDAGEMLLREMKAHTHLSYEPVGFVDDDPLKKGAKIHGLRVLGGIEDLPRIVERETVDEVIVSIPSATGTEMNRVLDVCRDLPVRLRRLPTEGDIVRLTQIRTVNLEDLLARPPIRLNERQIREGLRGQRILVTGAGGSIGSELVRQIAVHGPERIGLVDWSENSLFFLERELLDRFPGTRFDLLVADIRDAARIDRVFAKGGYHHVYHAAAFKHVPLMEGNPLEAVKNNVGGTKALAECAIRHGVGRFVFISSDKAVRPTSVMGATKRAAELMLSGCRDSGPEFLSVRFGNVLGSSGSVVPLFHRQIRDGGPVTVTDPEVVRYFMTIPEAVQLVLQAGMMGRGGEVFLLDMGEPVKILDLARKLIRLSGFQPDVDIPIRYVGLRPGEKLYEELLVDEESSRRTEHEKIWVLERDSDPPERISAAVDDLLAAAEAADLPDAMRALGSLVPEYRPGPAADNRKGAAE